MSGLFSKVLVANRGEIACRVIHAARALGINSVAVYSDADTNALHVELADEAVRIGPAAAAESYLNHERIIQAAKDTGCDAIHPGYGFLSENPEFVEACDSVGLVFIGPSAESIRAMGLKDAAKRLMEQAGVPVVPGYHGEDQADDTLQAHARDVGYPVLIKARAGGGGKGMRRVNDDAEFRAALDGARREARAAFGDDRVLIERYVQQPRHIEVQVVGDRHGNVVHLFERDCSLQRRHQKVIEEAPAPGMTNDVRAAMTDAAVTAARAINYVGAGTIEFIVDSHRGLRSDGFWFMEMNTRLQVEHPVTEAVTGIDLVEWQFRVASGQALPLDQDQIALSGHSVEARLYAEDVRAGFLPATGPLARLRFGQQGRVDSGVRSGDVVSAYYDPMLAKLIAHDTTREQALRKLDAMLGDTHVFGTVTNRDFLRELCQRPEFQADAVDTGFIEQHMLPAEPVDTTELERHRSGASDTVSVRPDVAERAALAVAALAIAGHSPATAAEPASAPAQVADVAGRIGAWQLWGNPGRSITLNIAGTPVPMRLRRTGPVDWLLGLPDGTTIAIGDVIAEQLQGLADSSATARLTLDGIACDVEMLTLPVVGGVRTFWVRAGQNITALSQLCDHASAEHSGSGGQLLAPMPGRVLAVQCAEGERVSAGDPLVTLEAMKMEHNLTASADGVIQALHVQENDQVEHGALLLVLE